MLETIIYMCNYLGNLPNFRLNNVIVSFKNEVLWKFARLGGFCLFLQKLSLITWQSYRIASVSLPIVLRRRKILKYKLHMMPL